MMFRGKNDLIVAFGIVLVVVMMVIPIPPRLLDILLSANISFSLIVLLVTTYIGKALDFSVFPSVLLIATLFRLALNVSSTRLILLHGYAGHVIQSFGAFVVGGSYVVGMVVFAILVVIQFVVITSGATRIAEVAARFTLDAMPGKQMSIDADLNAGLITEEEARRRRRDIEREADFYGAMDGASKFVRGDAIAGVVIVLVNLLGGFAVGVLQKGMSLGDAMQTYALLTVGDGLVTQIPALLVSTASAMVVTRAASETNLGEELVRQLSFSPRAITVAATIIGVLALVPGLPKLPFMTIAAGIGGIAYALRKGEGMKEEVEKEPPKPAETPLESVSGLLSVDPIELNLSYTLIPLVQEGGGLLDRISALRRQVASELGIVIPPIRIRDDIRLKPNSYSVKLRGVEVGRGEAMIGYMLAMDPGTASEKISGIPTKDPAFGLPAMWIPEMHRERAERAGYTVVDPITVIITHLSEIIKAEAAEILTRQGTKELLDNLRAKEPAVVEEVVPNLLSIGEVQRVLQALLKEGISIRDLPAILEAIGDYARSTKDPEILAEHVRRRLSRFISQIFSQEGVIYAILLDPELEDEIANGLMKTEDGISVSIPPDIAQKAIKDMGSVYEEAVTKGKSPVVLTSGKARLGARKLFERFFRRLPVLAFEEISPGVRIESVGVVRKDYEDKEV
jgi:flagellar biosynthesis protein FlhA